jgi:MATE family multidrug resistance protein
MLVYVARHARYRDLGLVARFDRPDRPAISRLLRVGLPAGAMVFVEGSIFAAVALIMGTLGTRVVAAHQVAINFAAITFMVPLGLSMAISVRVGQAVGRRDPAAVRFAAGVGIAMALACQVVSASVMAFAPRAVAGLYTDDAEVIALAADLLLLAAVFQLSDGVQASSAGALRGIKDTRVPMAIVVVAYWLVGFPLGWALAFAAGLGARGLWIGLIAGLTAAAALLAVRFHRVSARPERWG